MADAIGRLPLLVGSPIRIRTLPSLSAHRGKLLSGGAGRGTPVHAATFIRERTIVLETELLRRPPSLRLTLVHELFHFVWARLGNSQRRSYSDLLAREVRRRARAELGESSSVKKNGLVSPDAVSTRQWSDYVCESFCDTAAWHYSGIRRHREFGLAPSWRRERQRWFRENIDPGCRV